jgi:hypothetical protein
MGVILTEDLPYDPGRFLMRLVIVYTKVKHSIKHPPVYRF